MASFAAFGGILFGWVKCDEFKLIPLTLSIVEL